MKFIFTLTLISLYSVSSANAQSSYASSVQGYCSLKSKFSNQSSEYNHCISNAKFNAKLYKSILTQVKQSYDTGNYQSGDQQVKNLIQRVSGHGTAVMTLFPSVRSILSQIDTQDRGTIRSLATYILGEIRSFENTLN